jgi:hypothetical protein
VSKNKTLKKYRIKYGLDKGKKKKLPKRMTTYNQYNSRSKNPKPPMDIETLDNGVSSPSYKDVVKKR